MDRAALTEIIEAARRHDPSGKWGYGSRVSTRHRYVYLSVPKAACSTIKVALHRLEGLDAAPERWGEVHDGSFGLSLLDQSTDTAVEALTSADYLRFGFVRNPYDRLLSAWKSKLTAVLERLHAPATVVAMATTVTNATTPIPLADVYDSGLARRVHEHYLADFETYGYDEHSWRSG